MEIIEEEKVEEGRVREGGVRGRKVRVELGGRRQEGEEV